ncbi:MAG: DUF63 family protein [Candidatus Bilamarchaeaceae archaeon]
MLNIHAVDSMEKFIYEYFVDPIISKTGYNIVNTITYAIIAIVAIYIIYGLLQKSKIKIDNNFIFGALSFVLLGSTMRVITDSIDTGVFASITPIHKLILDSHIYDYGFLTVTPGIYIVTAFLFLSSVFLLNRFGKIKYLWKVGMILWLPHFLLVLPFSKYFLLVFAIVIMAAIPLVLARILFKENTLSFVVGAHALDGAATFIAIEIAPIFAPLSYFEQHVFSRWIGIVGDSYFLFYFVKIAISVIAAWAIKNEKMDENEKNYICLVLIIMGLAPGLRDMLRLLIGA